MAKALWVRILHHPPYAPVAQFRQRQWPQTPSSTGSSPVWSTNISRSSNAKDTELRTPECGLDSCTGYQHDSLVQLAGHRPLNPGDVSSNLTGITITIEYLLMLLIQLGAEGFTTCRGAMEFSVSIPRDTLGEELLHASDDMRGGGNRQQKSRGTV